MRLLVTADLHYNHPKSRAVAEALIERINGEAFDALLVVGDTGVAEGDCLEACLKRFRFDGPKLFVPGNHELWSHGDDSYELLHAVLPRRVRAAGWHWLPGEPFRSGDVAVVGSLGWYDYSFAPPGLGIPRRFYERKVSPGAAGRLSEFAGLLHEADDVSAAARAVVARWNDGKFVNLHRSDEAFLGELLDALRADLTRAGDARTVVAAVHHLPFRELLPPPRNAQWDFAKAFLGSGRIGELLLEFPNVRHLFCGHSHFESEAQVGPVHAVNVGSGYRWKTFRTVEV